MTAPWDENTLPDETAEEKAMQCHKLDKQPGDFDMCRVEILRLDQWSRAHECEWIRQRRAEIERTSDPFGGQGFVPSAFYRIEIVPNSIGAEYAAVCRHCGAKAALTHWEHA